MLFEYWGSHLLLVRVALCCSTTWLCLRGCHAGSLSLKLCDSTPLLLVFTFHWLHLLYRRLQAVLRLDLFHSQGLVRQWARALALDPLTNRAQLKQVTIDGRCRLIDCLTRDWAGKRFEVHVLIELKFCLFLLFFTICISSFLCLFRIALECWILALLPCTVDIGAKLPYNGASNGNFGDVAGGAWWLLCHFYLGKFR